MRSPRRALVLVGIGPGGRRGALFALALANPAVTSVS